MYCYECMNEINDGDSYCAHCGKLVKPDEYPHHLAPGTILHGQYLVGNSIGEGGFGITYIGRDLNLDIRIAIKEFFPSGYANRNNTVTNRVTLNFKNEGEYFRDGKESFLEEARKIEKFRKEDGIVDVRTCFEENDTAYIIMEYLDGMNLSRKISGGNTFAPEEIFRRFIPMMHTLDKLHSADIIHRDISPENIRLLSDGTLKLMDFGSARYFAGLEKRTMSVQFKEGYAPFEQHNKKGNQGPWTDVYGLCATIYKCVTGKTPVDSLERCQNDTLKKPSELGVRISEPLERVLMYGMAIYPENRCKSMGELIEITEKALNNEHVTLRDADNTSAAERMNRIRLADGGNKTAFLDDPNAYGANQPADASELKTTGVYDSGGYGADHPADASELKTTGVYDSGGYGAQNQGYGNQNQAYGAQNQAYGAQNQGYGNRNQAYGAQNHGYGNRNQAYGAQNQGYGNRNQAYGAQNQGYGIQNRGVSDPAKRKNIPEQQEKKRSPAPWIVLFSVLGVLIIGAVALLIVLLMNSGGSSDRVETTAPIASEAVETEPETEPETEAIILVPNIVGMKSSDAYNRLTEEGLKYKTEFEYSSSVPKDYVISQSPSEDTKAVAGDTVTFVISKGEKEDEEVSQAPQSSDPGGAQNSAAPAGNGDPTDSFNLRASSRYLSSSDVSWMSKDQIQLAINELYAKHGFKFTKDPYKSYFNGMSWYNPDTNDMNTVAARMNKYEKENLKVMANHRNSL